MNHSKHDVKKQIKSAQDLALLGHLVYWSISEFRMSDVQYKSLLAQVGIDEARYAKSVRPQTILTAVLKTKTKGSRDKFHRKSVDDKSIAGFAILNQTTDSDANVTIQQETKVVFDKETKAVRVEGNQKDEIQDTYKNFLGTFSQDQFRTLVLKYLRGECEAISLRDTGGVYFVPIKHEEAFRKLEQLFKLIPQSSIEVLPIPNLEEAKQTMWKALVTDLTGEIKELSEEISGMVTVSPKVFARRVDKFKQLKAKTEMYGELLSGTFEDLTSRIDSLENRLSEKLPTVGTAANNEAESYE